MTQLLHRLQASLREFTETAQAYFRARTETGTTQMVVEELEPRILHSADFSPAVISGDALTAFVENRELEAAAVPAEILPSEQIEQTPAVQLVFVDTSTPDYQTLLDDIATRTGEQRLEVVMLDSDSDGIEQITEALAARTDVAAIHIISHGSDGAVKLGQGALDASSIEQNSDQITGWSAALTENADLLIYGCDVAQSDAGRDLMQRLSSLTGADVAASDDLTGATALGGDWILEFSTGVIETDIAFSQYLQESWGHSLNITVDATTTDTTPNSTPADSVSHTTSGNDRLMLVGISFGEDKGNSVTSVTYNGTALSLVGARDNNDTQKSRVEIWQLVAPDLGTSNVVVNYSGTSHEGATIGVMTFNGVDQATPLGSFGSGEGDSSAPSATVASASGEVVFGVVAFSSSNNENLNVGTGQTEYWDLHIDKANGAGSTEAGAASVTTSWSVSDSQKWVVGGVSIKASVPGQLTVDTTNDVIDGNTASITALLGNKGADGFISLREAIIATNNTSGSDTIILPSGTYTLSLTGSGEDAAATGDLDINSDLTILGAGADATVIDGVNNDRVFHVLGSAFSSISGVTVTNGNAGTGGGIEVDNTGGLLLRDTAVSFNQATSGGGIMVNGTLILDHVTIEGNSASSGGGIYLESAVNATLSNVTISANTASGGGAITTKSAAVAIINSTIASNVATSIGGINMISGGSATLQNTILSNNAGNNTNGAVTSAGNNIDSANTAALSGPGDQINTDPLLGPLQYNGGTTKTMALLAGSLAINAGEDSIAPATDQRGFFRNATSDIGAYEFNAVSAANLVALPDNYTVNEDTLLDSTSSWYDTNWLYRRTLAFDNSAQTENLVNVPVLVTLDSTRIDYGKTKNAGEDLRFVDGDGTLLAHEIEKWDELGTSTVWVKVPQVDAGSNTDFIWMYYGNGAAADGQNAAGVWDASHKAVWHLDETSGTHADSTSNTYDLTKFGGVTQGVPGTIGGADDFPGSGHLRGFGSGAHLQILGDVTLEAWVNINTYPPSSEFASIVEFAGSGDAEPENYLYSMLLRPGGDINLGHESGPNPPDNDEFYDMGVSLNTGQWYQLTAVRDTAANEWRLYIDGSFAATTPYAREATGGTASDVWMGRDTVDLDGTIDEVRISDTQRSADWIKAQYRSTADSFVTYGFEQDQPAAGVLGNDFDADGDALTAALVTGPANAASFSLNADGTFTYDPVANFNGTDSFTYRTNDGGADSNIATVSITVTPVNDAPSVDLDAGTGGVNYAFTFTEGDAPTAIVDASVTVADIDDTTLINVILDTGGIVDGAAEQLTIGDLTFALNAADFSNATVDISGNAHTVAWVNATGIATITLNSGEMSIAQSEAVMLATAYLHTDTGNPTAGARTIDVRVNDGDTDSTVATTTINVIAVNDAPVLDNSGAPTLTTINENEVNNSGDLVSAIIASDVVNPITDVDAGAVEGIAVISVDDSNGTWEYSTNGGSSWTPFGSVSDNSAVVLGDSASDRIRFIPDTNFNGTALIAFRAWDLTDGNASGTAGVNASANGDTLPFSIASETASITTTPVELVLHLATVGDVTGSGVAGLNAWSASEMLALGDPNIAFEPGLSSGTLSSLGDLDSYASVAVSIEAMHVVSSNITVGGGGNTIDLQAGDTLFSVAENNVIFTGLDSVAVSTTKDDVIRFRPGDETFEIVLDDVLNPAVGSISLVEQATTVGDVVLARGAFLLNAVNTNDILYLNPTGAGQGVAAGTPVVLIAGADIGLGGGSIDIGGIDLIEDDISPGNATLTSGQILVTLDGDDLAVGGNNLGVLQNDIFYLDVITATMGITGTTSATATLLVEGADIYLDTSNEIVTALSLDAEFGLQSIDPAISLPGGAANYTESSPPIIIDGAATLVDPDSADFAGGQLSVDLIVGGTANDRLAIRNQGTGVGQVGVSGNTVSYEGTDIGTFTGGGDGASPLVVTFNSSADVAAVQAVMKNTTYENVSSNPSTIPRTVRFALTDGDGGGSNVATETINVIAVNNIPTLTTFTTVIDSVNEDTEVELTFAELNAQGDEADVDGTVDSYVVQAVSTGSLKIGTSAGIATAFAAGTNDTIDATRHAYWTPAAHDFGATIDAFTVVAVDNVGGLSVGAIQAQVQVNAVNDASTVDLDTGTGGVDYAFTFTEGDGATTIVDATVAVADVDDTTLVNVTLDAGGMVDGAAEQLTIGDLSFALNAADFTNATVNIGGNTYTVNWVNATGIAIITLNSGEMTIAQSQAVMLASAYQHTDAVNPTAGARTIDVRVNDGDTDSAVATSTITVAAVNSASTVDLDTGTGGVDYAFTFTEGDGATAIVDATVAVADVDDTTLVNVTLDTGGIIDGAAEQLTIGDLSFALNVADFTSATVNIGGNAYTVNWVNATGIATITLNSGEMTIAQSQAVMLASAYQHTDAVNPTAGARTIDIRVNDGDADSAVATSTITVAAVNSASTVDLDTGTGGVDYAFTLTEGDGATAIVDATVAVADVDDTTLVNVTLVTGGIVDGAAEQLTTGDLSFALNAADFTNATVNIGGNTYTVNWVNATGIATITLNSGEMTIAQSQAVMLATQYQHTDTGNPTGGNRTIDVRVNDGDIDSAVATSTITVAPVNDAPSLNAPGAIGVTEDVAIALAGISFSDVDAGGASVVATFTVAQGTLAATPSGGVTVGGTPTALTLTGSTANLDAFIAASNLTYTTALDDTSAVTLGVSVNDQGNTGSGGALSSGVTNVTLNVTPVNDASTVDLDMGTGGVDYAFTFTEGDPATAIVDASVAVADIDDTTLVSVTLDTGGIVDGAAEQLTVGDLTFALDAADFTNATVNIAGNAYTVDWVNATGVATITLNSGEMSIAQSRAVMLATQYQHTDTNNPTAGNRTIDVRVNDGNTDSAVATCTITVAPVNDAPTADLDTGSGGVDYAFTFTEGDPATAIVDATVAVADSDDTTLVNVTLDSGGIVDGAAEQLAIGDLTFALNAADFTNATVNIGSNAYTVNWINATGIATITLNSGEMSIAQSQAVMLATAYQHTDTVNPTAGNRTIDVRVNDGDTDSAVATSTITVAPVNDAPTVDLDSGTGGVDYAVTFTEGDPATAIVDASVAVADIDDTTLVNVTLDTGGIVDGAAEQLTIGDLTFALNTGDFTNATVTIGGNPYTVNWVNAAGIATITLNSGEMSIAQSQAVMLASAYQHTDTVNPTGGNRTIDVRVNDGDTDSGVATSTITVTPVSSAPTVDLDTGTGGVDYAFTFTEGDPATAIVDATVVVADIDDTTLVNVTLDSGGIIDAAAEQLTIGDLTFALNAADFTNATVNIGGNPYTVNWVTATGIATITLNSGEMSIAQSQAVMLATQYQHTDTNNPTAGNRTIDVRVNDGDTDSAVATSTITVAPVNDAPGLGAPGAIGVTEDVASALTGISFSDVDAGGASVVATFTVSQGMLTATPSGGVTVGGSPTALTLTGSTASLDAFIAASNLTYTTALNDASAVTLGVSINDQGNTGSGGALSSGVTNVTLNVTPVNDASTVDLNTGTGGVDYAFTFTEGDPATAIVDATVAVADVDDTTLVNVTLDSGGIVDGAAEQLTIGDLSFALNTGDFTNATVNIGGNAYTVTWINASGIATITLNSGEMSIAQSQAVMLASAYQHTDTGNPTAGNRTIDVRVNDGNTDSAVATSTITVAPLNDAPTLDLDTATGGVDYTFTFTEGDPATAIVDASVIVADVDDTTLVNVTLDTGGIVDAAAEQLTIGDLTFALNTGDFANATVNIGGNAYTVNWVNATGIATITLNSGEMSIAQSQAVMLATQYQHTDTNNPTAGNRTIEVRVNDGNTDSAVATSTITVVPLNDAPTLDLDTGTGGVDYAFTFTEGDAATAIVDATVVVADIDDTTLVNVTLDTGGIVDGAAEQLTIGDLTFALNAADFTNATVNIGGNAYTVSWVNATAIATITLNSGEMSIAQSQAVMLASAYQHTDTVNPTGGNRTIDVRVNDGDTDSPVATSTITVVSVSSAPTVDLNTGTGGVDYAFTFTEGDAATAIVDTTVVVADIDDTTLVNVTLDSGGIVDGAAEQLTIGDLTFALNAADFANATVNIGGNAYTVNWVNATAIATITLNSGEMSIAQSRAVMLASAYQHTDTANPTGGNRTIDVRVNDGDTDSAVATSTITVAPVNDAPGLGAPGAIGVTEDVASALTGISFSDVDAGGASVVATFTVSQGMLTATPSGGVTVGGTPTALTLTGSTASINAFIAASNLTYTTALNDISAVTLGVSVNDQGNTGSGGALSSGVTNVTLNVTPVNDASTVDLNTGTGGVDYAFTFTEGDPATAIVDATVIVADIDDTTLVNVTLDSGGIVDGAAEQLSVGDLTFALNAADFTNTTVNIGGNAYTVNWVNASGIATITLNSGEMSIAQSQAVMLASAYQHTDTGNPTGGNRTIDVRVNDGDTDSAVATSTITVVPANDASTVDLDTGTGGVGYVFTFTEGDAATAIVDASVIVADVDDTTLVNVTLDTGGIVDGAAEQLTIGDLTFALNTGDFTNATVTIGGNPYTVNWVNATGIATIILNSGEMSIAQSQAVMLASAYQHTDTVNPTGGNRTMDVRVNDGDTDSAVATSTITVARVNSAPTVDLDTGTGGVGYAFTFTEGDAATAIVDAAVAVADVDDTTLVNVTLDTGGIVDGAAEQLTIGDLTFALNAADFTNATVNIGGNAYTVSWVNAAGIATITLNSGEMSIAQSQAVMLASAYQHTDTVNPTGGNRTIDARVNDGDTDSPVATSTITVVSVSSAPTVDLNTGTGGVDYAFTFTEGDAATAIVDTTVVVADIDDTTLVNVTLDSGGIVDGAAEQLTIGDLTFALNAADFANATVNIGGDAYTVNWVNATAIATITLNSGEMSIAQSQAVMLASAYQHTDTGNPTGGNRTIDVRVNDGDTDSAVATSTITVAPVNDAPGLGAPGAIGVTEDVANALTGISFSDIDAAGASVVATFTVAQGTLAATPSGGVIVGGTPTALTLTGSTASINAFIAASNLTYTTALNDTSAVTLGVSVNDQGNTGGGALSSGVTNVTLNVSAVNDAPSLTAPGAIGVTEDVATALSGISFSDVDAAGTSVVATFTVAQGTLAATTGGGVSVAGTPTALTLTGSTASIDAFIAASNLTYTTAPDDTSPVTLGVSVNDQGNTGSGGALSSGVSNVTLNVTPVDDAPTGAVNIIGTPTEDQVLTASNTLADADGLGAISYQWQRNGVNIVGATANTYTLGDVDVGTTISLVASYVDGFGTPESVSSAGVGPIVNVNDAPLGIPTITGTVTEDQVLSVDTSGISDTDGLGAFSYQWLRNGGAITGATASTYTLGDADVGTLISVQASYTDAYATAEGPLASVQTAAVSGINDAPAISTLPPAQAVVEGAVLSFSTTNGNAIAISDVDAGAAIVELSLSATNGTLTLASIAGLGFSSGDGSADATMQFTGSLANINNALNGLQFTSNSGFAGNATVSASINDLGNTGAGGPLLQAGAVNISVTAATIPIVPVTPPPPVVPPVVPPTPTPDPDPDTDPPAPEEAGAPAAVAPAVISSAGNATPLTSVLADDSTRDAPALRAVHIPDSQLNRSIRIVAAGSGFDVGYFGLTGGDLASGNLNFVVAPITAFPSFDSGHHALNAPEFVEELDRMREILEQQAQSAGVLVTSGTAATVGLSVGYLFWLLRAEVLLGSLLSSMPAWRMVDPLPVLGRLASEDDEDGDEDDDSIESMVERNNRGAQDETVEDIEAI